MSRSHEKPSLVTFNSDSGIVRIFDEITPDVTMGFAQFLERFLEYPPGEITKEGQVLKRRILIEIMSHGGCLASALGIYDILRQQVPPFVSITTIGIGYVGSSATLIFATGQQRIALPNCDFTLHEPSMMAHKFVTTGELVEQQAYLGEMETRMYTIYQNLTGKTRKALEKQMKGNEIRLIGEEVVNWGLATEVSTRGDDKVPAFSGKIITPRR